MVACAWLDDGKRRLSVLSVEVKEPYLADALFAEFLFKQFFIPVAPFYH